MIIVADTSPLNYLVLIGEASLLHRLFGQVVIPHAVFDELQDEDTPQSVRAWIADSPPWLHVVLIHPQIDPALDYLDMANAKRSHWQNRSMPTESSSTKRQLAARQPAATSPL